MELEKFLKSYIETISSKDSIINELINRKEIKSIKELEYSIIINAENNRTYEMLYNIKNDEITITDVYKIFNELPLNT